MARTFCLLFAMFLLSAGHAFAQLAVETMDGVRHYGGGAVNGGTTSVELIPGHQQFFGAVEGSVTEIMPGVTHYNLRPSLDSYEPIRVPPMQTVPDRSGPDRIRRALQSGAGEPQDQWIKDLTGR